MPAPRAHLQLIDVIYDDHHHGEYLVRTWNLTEPQRRSLVKLLGPPNHEAYVPQAAVMVAQAAAARAGMVVVESNDTTDQDS